MTVVPYETRRREWLAIQNPALELANAIAGTDFVPSHFRNNPPAIAAAILYGDEVGLGPMQSLAKIAVINGRPTLAAEAQRALILQAGHDIWVEESTPTRCVVCGRRRNSDAVSRISWTMDDAKRAGLAGKPTWRAYPRQMLLARASSDLARAIFPDAIGGLSATEELEDGAVVVDANGEVEAAPRTTRRRRASVTAPAPTPDSPATVEPPPPDLPPLPGEDVIDVTPSDPGQEPGPEGQPDPTTPAPPPEAPPTMISDGQRKKLQALFREAGITDRQARLDYCTAQVGRPIYSANGLTFDEASQLIDHLASLQEAPPTPEFATEEQREMLFQFRHDHGISDLRLREILLDVTGQQLTSQIPYARFDDVMAALAQEAAPFE